MKTPGQVAYEAAQQATGCDQPWEQANQRKWEAAAHAIIDLAAGECKSRMCSHGEQLGAREARDRVLALKKL